VVHKNGEVKDIHLRGAAIDRKTSRPAWFYCRRYYEPEKDGRALQESEAKYPYGGWKFRRGVCIIQDGLFRYANKRWVRDLRF